jgi:hypothetical protein
MSSSDPANLTGYGYGVFTVGKTGKVNLVGTLPTGQAFAAGLQVDTAGTIPVYLAETAARPGLAGRIQFRDLAGASDADGSLVLQRAVLVDVSIQFQAARYAAPSHAAARAVATQWEIHVMRPGAAEVSGIFPAVSPLITQLASGELIKLRIQPKTGVFSGTSTIVGQPVTGLAGVIYQKAQTKGFGRLRRGAGAIELDTVTP